MCSATPAPRAMRGIRRAGPSRERTGNSARPVFDPAEARSPPSGEGCSSVLRLPSSVSTTVIPASTAIVRPVRHQPPRRRALVRPLRPRLGGRGRQRVVQHRTEPVMRDTGSGCSGFRRTPAAGTNSGPSGGDAAAPAPEVPSAVVSTGGSGAEPGAASHPARRALFETCSSPVRAGFGSGKQAATPSAAERKLAVGGR